MTAMMDREAFEAALRQIGAERYHHLHPFQQMLQNGELRSTLFPYTTLFRSSVTIICIRSSRCCRMAS